MNQAAILRELQTIPSIGKACALDLWHLGIRSVADLRGQNPAVLYERLNALSGVRHYPCMLYMFRCAVYYATEPVHEPEKLKWWYWKDKTYRED
jgi:hypothetical protein